MWWGGGHVLGCEARVSQAWLRVAVTTVASTAENNTGRYGIRRDRTRALIPQRNGFLLILIMTEFVGGWGAGWCVRVEGVVLGALFEAWQSLSLFDAFSFSFVCFDKACRRRGGVQETEVKEPLMKKDRIAFVTGAGGELTDTGVCIWRA